MSAASDIDADKEALAKPVNYADLPAELRIKIIHAFLANFRKQSPPQKLAPFAVLHSEWQHELEPQDELWGSICLTPQDLPLYRVLLDQRRGDALSKVVLWVPIDGDAITPNRPDFGYVDLIPGVNKLVVHSFSSLLKCVDYAKSLGSLPARKAVQFHTQITFPGDIQGMMLHNSTNFEFDFSQLPPTDAVSAFSQGQFVFSKKTIREGVAHRQIENGILLLKRSALLSLFTRLPNLEDANVSLNDYDIVPFVTTPQINPCPRLKILSLARTHDIYRWALLGYALSGWASNWSQNIERLSLDHTTDITAFLRGLSTPSPRMTTITWSCLQVLDIKGWLFDCGDHVDDILSAIPAALIALPVVRDITITQKCSLTIRPGIMTDPHIIIHPSVVITLNLGSQSSKFTILMDHTDRENHIAALEWEGLGEDINPLDRKTPYFWNLIHPLRETRFESAVADIQAAVRTQRGQVLEVTLPEKDDEPEVAMDEEPPEW